MGGANPHELEATRTVATEVADALEQHLEAHGEA